MTESDFRFGHIVLRAREFFRGRKAAKTTLWVHKMVFVIFLWRGQRTTPRGYVPGTTERILGLGLYVKNTSPAICAVLMKAFERLQQLRAYFHNGCVLQRASYRWLSLATQRHATQRAAVMETGPNAGKSAKSRLCCPLTFVSIERFETDMKLFRRVSCVLVVGVDWTSWSSCSTPCRGVQQRSYWSLSGNYYRM